MFCPMCGAPNEDDSEFCGNCGAALALEDAPLEPEVDTPEEAAEAPEEVVGEAAPEAHVAVEVTEDEVEEISALPETEDADLQELEVAIPAPPVPPAPLKPAAPAVPTSGLAVASLVLAVGGLTILPLIGSIVAIILGYMARNDIRRRPGEVSGDGIATAGIVLGWIAVGLSVLGLLLFGGLTVCGVCGAIGSGG
jgi:hypothetical protein